MNRRTVQTIGTLRIGGLAIELGLSAPRGPRLGTGIPAALARRYGAFLSPGDAGAVVPGEARARISIAFGPPATAAGSSYDPIARIESGRLRIASAALAAEYDLERGEGRIELADDPIGGEYFLENALRQIAQTMLADRGAVLLHAAGIVTPDGERALAFAGRSGAGKSTISALLAGAGGEVLSDDLVLLETRGPRRGAAETAPRLSSTPFYGTCPPARRAPRSVPLAQFFLLEQAPVAELARVPEAGSAVALLLANVPFTGCFDRAHRERVLATLLTAVRRTPVGRLRFRKDLSMLPLLPWERGADRPAARLAPAGAPR